MAKSRFTPTQTAQLRERIARESARLLMRGKVKSFHTARSRAARWLSQEKLTSAEMPTQEEIARELQVLTQTFDWDQLTRVDWVIEQTYAWLSFCQPRINTDWKKTCQSEQITLFWLIEQSQELALRRLLLERKISSQSRPLAEGLTRYEFNDDLSQVVFVAAKELLTKPMQDQDNAQAETVTVAIQGTDWEFETPRFSNQGTAFFDEADFDENEVEDWSEFFKPLLKMQEHLEWDQQDHPEGNILFHTLQVFALGRELHPWDEEFLWACLLHDLGMVIDRRHPQEACRRLLTGRVSERLFFLVSELPNAQKILEGNSPAKSLRKDESYEELLDLARCDRDGRQPGAEVPTLEEAIQYLQSLESLWDDQEHHD